MRAVALKSLPLMFTLSGSLRMFAFSAKLSKGPSGAVSRLKV